MDTSVCFETRSEQGLSHYLWDHHHADVSPQAFVAAETEVKVVIRVAAGDELIGILECFRIEHGRLGDG